MKTKLVIFTVFLLLTSCAPAVSLPAGDYGFWYGLAHGFILLFSFIISLFDDTVAVYAVNNTGHLYNLGFVLGVNLISSSYTLKIKQK